ncbi:hypothetical protein WJX72_006779 [[Myrmecia] bisecta]|uniref:SMP-30/Gluconolactonase/LRE-like region domain-containing protein n=1 Tax=[Myrmecia] bisecta TaxID=41462 RepID=A0AAW1PDT9_9CHLO
MAFGPHDGDLYVCQYSVPGVLQFHGGSLKYRRVFARGRALADPEGIAFAQGHMYVASARHSSIVCLSLDGYMKTVTYLLSMQVPWGMAVGPDDALYVTQHPSYESGDYRDPMGVKSSEGQGQVARLAIGADGQLTESTGPAIIGNLTRPSGVCFDPAGNLYVTSMGAQVLKYAMR